MSETTFASLRIWEYQDTSAPPAPVVPPSKRQEPAQPAAEPVKILTEEQFAIRLQSELLAAEQRWTAEARAREAALSAKVEASLSRFLQDRGQYFHRAEKEVVQLALAVARKILQREATLDPDLLAALVRLALEKMGAGSAVRLRVPQQEFSRWQQKCGRTSAPFHYEVVADPELLAGDCLVETDLGAASFGFEVQLKHIERGMLDLLQARPGVGEPPHDIASSANAEPDTIVACAQGVS